MVNENNLFIQLDYRVQSVDSKLNADISGAHINYKKNVEPTRYLIGCGVYNRGKGKLLFKVRNLDEANEFLNNNFFTKNTELKYNEVKCNFVTAPNVFKG